MLPMIKLTALAPLLLASACPKPVSTPLPPAQDVEGATETKPLPSPEAVFDAKAKARDDAALEAWGERLRSAGVRVCEWLNAASKDADYECGD